jgi:hypothetical protein
LFETDRLLVDGTNLLHALSRRRPAPNEEVMPPAALIGRLRGIIPAPIGIELIFDGMPDRGMRGERVAAGLIVRYAGRRSADELLLSLVDETRAAAGADAAAGLLVVSDDRALRNALHLRGARTAGCSWLLGRLERPKLAAPSVGNRRAAKPSTSASTSGSATASAATTAGHGAEPDDEGPRSGWKPGRGATKKRGNPRRGRSSSGRMPG